MTDENLDRLLAGVAVSDADVARLDLLAGERELLEEIMSTPVLDQPERRADETDSTNRRNRWFVPSLAAAAAVAAVTTASVWAPWSDDASRPGGGQDTTGVAAPAQSSAPASPEPVPEVSAGNPLVLVDDPAWKVTRVDESAKDYGEMTFSDGRHSLDVHWYPAEQYDSYFEDRAYGNKQQSFTVLGREGTLFRYGSSTDFTTMLPADGPTFLEIRGDLGSRDAYVDLMDRLKQVDLETWAAALPSTVVDPATAEATIAEMLSDVPLPRGFDAGVLEAGLFADHYQVGAEVTGAVACAWLDQWDDARKAEEPAVAEQAVTALQTSHQWAVLRQMDEQGDYPEVLWEIADAAVAGSQTVGGTELERGDWMQGLGCDSSPRSLNMD
jgi:hypothetical protein